MLLILITSDYLRLVDTGIDDSLNYKYTTFSNLIRYNLNHINLLIGLGPFKINLKNLTAIDFDIGYMLAYYGLIGFLVYILMVIYLYKYRNQDNEQQDYSILNVLLIIVLILFGFTGGVFFNLRIFSTFSTLVFAKILDAEEFYE